MQRPDIPAIKPITGTAEEIAREERRVASGMLANVVDVHTHLWPDGFYKAILQWFDDHAWRIQFRGHAEAAVEKLRREGVAKNVALVYAHKPGIARFLNGFLTEMKDVIGVGTALPGETDARAIVMDAARAGLRGIKIHCHVQAVAIDDPRTMEILRACEDIGMPAVVHAGRQPRVPGYGIDPFEICEITRTERVLRALPKLKLVIPHLGLDEVSEHFALLDRHENLYLDTSMACADYFDVPIDWTQIEKHADRILYGSDFPITPFDTATRELHVLARRIESDDAFEKIVRTNARTLWQI